MRIGMVLKSNFPPDIRVEKEARTLLSAGHKVYLICQRKKNVKEPTGEDVNGVLVSRIPPPEVKLPLFRRLWNSLKFYLTFRDDYWAGQIERFTSDLKLDVLHIHDLPLLGTAIYVGQKLGIPVIADLHENYPAVLQIIYKDKPGIKERFNKSPKRWLAYERKSVGSVRYVIVVVDEAKQRLIEQHGIPDDKITVIMNVEDISNFSNIELDLEILKRYQDKFLISYVGGGGPHRGLDTAIRSISYLKDEIPDIKLLLVGPKDSDQEWLWKVVGETDVKDHVEIIDWQPFEKVPSYIQASDICLIPHNKSAHTDTTIPHKLFQYMLMGKPVVVSNCLPLKRIVKETGSGLVFRAENPQDLADSIIKLFKNRGLREKCGKRGHEAVLSRYNWSIESKKLCSLYKSIEEKSDIH